MASLRGEQTAKTEGEATDLRTSNDADERAMREPHLVFQHGKYKGRHLADVWELEPSYVRWVAGFTGGIDADSKRASKVGLSDGRSTVVSHGGLLDAAKKLLRRRCLFCFCPLATEVPKWHTHCRECFLEAQE